jgi:hypothetical protein
MEVMASSSLFEIARLLMRFDHVAVIIRKRESRHHVSDCETLLRRLVGRSRARAERQA